MSLRPATQAAKKPISKDCLEPIEPLFRALLDQLPCSSGVPAPVGEEASLEEIVFDVVLDGAHYLLVRLPLITRPPVQLSPREREIVRMVAQGNPNKVIADILNISSWTVCTHLRRIFAKLGVGSRAAMVARILEMEKGRETRSLLSSAVAKERMR